ncbi:hypothetical protein PMAYCL1PPCAC_20791, partial [Pristionchus mayeri]
LQQCRFVMFPEMFRISTWCPGMHITQHTRRGHVDFKNWSISLTNYCEVRNFTLEMMNIRAGFVTTIAAKETFCQSRIGRMFDSEMFNPRIRRC